MKRDKQLINEILYALNEILYALCFLLMAFALRTKNTDLLIVVSTWAILTKLEIIREELK